MRCSLANFLPTPRRSYFWSVKAVRRQFEPSKISETERPMTSSGVNAKLWKKDRLAALRRDELSRSRVSRTVSTSAWASMSVLRI